VSYFAFQYAGVEIILYKKTEPIVSKELGEKLPPSAPSLEKYFNAEETSVFGRYNMPTSFVLINTEIGFETDVLNELKKVEGVDEASAVYGVYDIVARVKADTMDRLKEIITWRIRRLDKVRSTLTMIVVEEKV
jgi:DNA-binding Lrp family transcriptional regulator